MKEKISILLLETITLNAILAYVKKKTKFKEKSISNSHFIYDTSMVDILKFYLFYY